MTTVIATGYNREISVFEEHGSRYLKVEDTSGIASAGNIQSFLSKTKAIELGKALLKVAGTSLEELAKEEAEAKKAEEKIRARRDELTLKFTGRAYYLYEDTNPATKNAIDYIIEQEDAKSWTPTT